MRNAPLVSPVRIASISALRELPSAGAECQIQRPRIYGLTGRVCRELLEHRQGIAQTTIGTVGDGRQRFVVDGDSLTARDLSHLLNHDRDRDAAKSVTLAAGENGDRQLLGLGCCEDENGVRRRLFQRL